MGGAIIGARYAAHLPENLAVFSFALDAADQALLQGVLAEDEAPRATPSRWSGIVKGAMGGS